MTAAAAPSAESSPDWLISAFRAVAIAEAISWGGLLLAMLFKYALAENEVGVQIMGPIHGAIFLMYLVTTLAVGVRCRWNASLILLGLFAAVPPFVTVVFEKSAERSGHLRMPEAEPAV